MKPSMLATYDPGKWIANDRNRGSAAQWLFRHRPSFVENFFDADHVLADHHLRHAPGPFREPESRSVATVPATPTTRVSPCRLRAVERINPILSRSSAVRAPACRARFTSSHVNSPTACVTSRSPRSLSGASSQAGTRTIAGWPGRSTALAMIVAAASAAAARSASTVTASAIPREKLRPRHPLVAMPRTGSAEFTASSATSQQTKDDPAAPPFRPQTSRLRLSAAQCLRRRSHKREKVSPPQPSRPESLRPPLRPRPPWA